MAFPELYGILVILSTFQMGCVYAQEDLNYIIASSTVAILFFFLCIVMCCLFYNCPAIYRSFGYDRIPKHELKRREAARTLVSHTSSQQYLTPVQVYEKDDVSWVQRWQERSDEERQDAVMQLGPEEEFRIETTLEDYSPRTAAVKAAAIDQGQDPIYSVVDKSQANSTVSANGSVKTGSMLNARDSTELL